MKRIFQCICLSECIVAKISIPERYNGSLIVNNYYIIIICGSGEMIRQVLQAAV